MNIEITVACGLKFLKYLRNCRFYSTLLLKVKKFLNQLMDLADWCQERVSKYIT